MGRGSIEQPPPARKRSRTLSLRELRLWAASAAGPAVATGFYALATARRRRSLHPTGTGYQGWLQVAHEGPARPDVPLFQAGATHPAQLRFSRDAGLPEPLPDALGVAIKLPNAHGPGADQDLLLTSSTDRSCAACCSRPGALPMVRSPPPCPTTSAATGSCCCWSQPTAVPAGPPTVMAIVLSTAPWPNCVPPPPMDSASSSGPPDPSAVPDAGHPEDRPAPASRANRSPPLQPLDHRTRHPPGRLAEPAPRRRLPGEPTGP